MAIAAAAVIVPLGLLFFISGLAVNLIQIEVLADHESFNLMVEKLLFWLVSGGSIERS
ncbi:hypothetical protein V6Z12_D11G244700 [Gossypium hirsutum]